MLLQRDGALSLRGAAADLPDRAADLSASRITPMFPDTGRRFLPMLCPTWCFQHDQLPHSGGASAFLLERDLRNGSGALHPAAHGACADQSQAGQVQRDGQRRSGQAHVLRFSKIAQPFLVLLVFNVAGLLVAIPRLLIWDRDRPGTVMMNVIWCFFNLVIIGVCISVARELKQRRASVRISVVTPVVAKLPDGRLLAGETMDLSSGGTSIRFSEAIQIAPETRLRLAFTAPAAGADVPATIISSEGAVQRVRFENLSIAEEEVLTMVLYSRADSWLGWGESRKGDDAISSLGKVFLISMHGLGVTIKSLFKKENGDGETETAAAPIRSR